MLCRAPPYGPGGMEKYAPVTDYTDLLTPSATLGNDLDSLAGDSRLSEADYQLGAMSEAASKVNESFTGDGDLNNNVQVMPGEIMVRQCDKYVVTKVVATAPGFHVNEQQQQQQQEKLAKEAQPFTCESLLLLFPDDIDSKTGLMSVLWYPLTSIVAGLDLDVQNELSDSQRNEDLNLCFRQEAGTVKDKRVLFGRWLELNGENPMDPQWHSRLPRLLMFPSAMDRVHLMHESDAWENGIKVELGLKVFRFPYELRVIINMIINSLDLEYKEQDKKRKGFVK